MIYLKFILFKIQNIGILVLVYGYAFFRGRATKKTFEPKNILIWQEAKLGDMVCTTPLFTAIKKSYPRARITVMGNRVNAELLQHHPYVDTYIIMDRSMFQNIRSMRQCYFDFACTITPNFRNLAAMYLAGIPLVAGPRVVGGWSPYQTKPYRYMLPLVVSVPHHFATYAPREYMRLLEPIAIHADSTKKLLTYSTEAKEALDNLLQSKKINQEGFLIVLSPVVANVIKQWPLERFAAVAEFLVRKHDAMVIVIGTKADIPAALKLMSHLETKNNIYNMAGELTLDMLKALISRADLFVSVDTGPVYVAEAFGVPTVDIVGPVAENEQPPQGEFNVIVKVAGDRIPQLHIMNARTYDKEEALRQVNGITVEQVTAACDILITKIKAQSN